MFPYLSEECFNIQGDGLCVFGLLHQFLFLFFTLAVLYKTEDIENLTSK